jgi:Flp pilus assembly protein TadD
MDNRKGDPDQRFAAALKLMKANQLPEAQPAFFALSRDYPNLSGPLTNLGILYARQHQHAQAVTAFIKAVTINPANAVAWNWLGSLYRESGDYLHAEQAYRQALALQPDYAAAHLNLGILYEVSLRRPQEALTQYRSYQEYAGKENLIVTAWIRELEATPTAAITVATGAPP